MSGEDSPAEPGLENYANKVAKSRSGADAARVQRWEARAVLWDHSTLDRVRACGRWAVTSDGSVQVRANGAAVGYAGLASCGSVWSCPVCSAKIQAVRRLELQTAIAWALGRGAVMFATYTLRHHAGMDLRTLLRAQSACWKSVLQSGTVRRLREALGMEHSVRAAESTYGAHGFHPHQHLILTSRRDDLDAHLVAQLHEAQSTVWVSAALRLGYDAPHLDAQDMHLVTGADAQRELSQYMAKAEYRPTAEAVAWEATGSLSKSGRRSGRTPWQVLDDFRTSGDLDDLDVWHRWERGSKGTRALSWSKGFRAAAGLLAEAKDEDIASAEVGTAADAGFVIEDWAPVRARPALGAQLLGTIRGGRDWAAGRRFCAENGIETREVAA
ncbi:protein rep [Pseudomonas sp. BAgro211]|nr:protein rep [Pseudomonas sp. BAgro211]